MPPAMVSGALRDWLSLLSRRKGRVFHSKRIGEAGCGLDADCGPAVGGCPTAGCDCPKAGSSAAKQTKVHDQIRSKEKTIRFMATQNGGMAAILGPTPHRNIRVFSVARTRG